MYASTCYIDKLTDQVVMDVQVEVIELLINAFTIVHTLFSYSYCVRVFARSENDYAIFTVMSTILACCLYCWAPFKTRA